MRIAMNAWSIPAHIPFDAMFGQIAAAGFAGIELNLDRTDSSAHSLTSETDSQAIRQIRSLSEQYRLPVCSVSTSLYGANQLGSADGAERRRGQDVIKRQLELARALDAGAILAVPGGISDQVMRLDAYAYAKEAILEIKGEIEASGIMVGLENVWNSFFLSPSDLSGFIADLDSPAIGAYFDVGNVAVFSRPEDWIAALAGRIVRIHIKDFKRGASWYSGHFVNLYEGSINWLSVMASLRQAGYDGWMTAELATMPQYPELLYQMTASAMKHMLET
ncbi:MAG: sugar phosphate isomerase/epimerase [Eubacteriales bacterium]|nr:sugar phosphate isomerase/epimerase [Clostridiales bacterium]MDD4743548.1 sugar phosphate isomerase/epimerase [Eubacteriales bacterium]